MQQQPGGGGRHRRRRGLLRITRPPDSTPAGRGPSSPPSLSPRPSATAPYYYAFAVFLTPLAVDLHTTTTAVTGTFTASVLVSALLAVPVGRWLDTATFAATTAGLFGILSVAGRLGTTGLRHRYRTTTVVAAVFAGQAVAALSLPVFGRNSIAAVIGVIGFGLGFGVGTIAKPVLLADRYDTSRYATLAGILVVPITLAKAVAPLAGSALHAAAGSYAPVFAAVAVCCAVAAAAIAASGATAGGQAGWRSSR